MTSKYKLNESSLKFVAYEMHMNDIEQIYKNCLNLIAPFRKNQWNIHDRKIK